jgi:pyruvate formate lyase activating enzyme
MQEAWCYDKLTAEKVKCNLCIHQCYISPGKRGFCKTRENVDGRLFNVIFGCLSSFSTDFVEKVPLYHFYPNQRFLTIGSVGCNLSCRFCLTWNITQKTPEEIESENLTPERLITAASELNCRGIAYTHSEPALNVEFFSEVMEKAKNAGLANVFATNGFISIEAFEKIADQLDAVALTFKGDREFYRRVCGGRYDEEHFRKLIKAIRDRGIHLEIVYVLIQGENDDEKSLNELVELAKLGASPIIFLRFFPSYKMEDIESPAEEILEHAVNFAYSKGVEHAYVENIFQHPGKNTYCPGCGSMLVEREGYGIVKWLIENKRCPRCKRPISIVGEPLLTASKV